jgi:hypothetical protein
MKAWQGKSEMTLTSLFAFIFAFILISVFVGVALLTPIYVDCNARYIKLGVIMKKSINVLSFLAMLFVCLMAQPAVAAPDQTGTIQYAGKSTQISIGEIGKDDKGKTTVQVLMDFEMLASAFDRNVVTAELGKALAQAIRVKIVAKNKIFELSTFTVEKITVTAVDGKGLAKIDHVIYHFDTAASPEKIMVYNKQDPGLTFSGKTKEIIK